MIHRWSINDPETLQKASNFCWAPKEMLAAGMAWNDVDQRLWEAMTIRSRVVSSAFIVEEQDGTGTVKLVKFMNHHESIYLWLCHFVPSKSLEAS